MKKLLFWMVLICSVAVILTSCSKDEESTTTDTTAPIIVEVTAVTTPTIDSTPDYTFSSDEAGIITYGGSCSSSTTIATTGNNTITLVSLSEGTYSDCTITVTDTTGNVSNTLSITSFISCTTDTTASGSITVGSETLSGVYVSPCNSAFATLAGSSWVPSDVLSGKTTIVVTGNTALTEEFLLYTDSSCSAPSLTWKKSRTDFTVGDAVDNGTKVTYKASISKIKPSTDVAKSQWDTFASSVGLSVTFTVGSETSITDSGSTFMNLFNVTSTTIKTGNGDSNTQPTAVDSMVMTKSCE